MTTSNSLDTYVKDGVILLDEHCFSASETLTPEEAKLWAAGFSLIALPPLSLLPFADIGKDAFVHCKGRSFDKIEEAKLVLINLGKPKPASRIDKLLQLVGLNTNSNPAFIETLCSWTRYRADLPVAPKAVRALCRRAQEIMSGADLYTLYLPQWQPQPNLDPIWLIGDHKKGWLFEIGRSGGDGEVIEEMLQALRSQASS